MRQEKAEIIGFLCAEGSHYDYISRYWEYDPRRNNIYFRVNRHEAIDFGNNNPLLLNRFLNLLKNCYNYERRITGVPDARKVVIGKKVVIKDLLSYTDYGHLRWRVPKAILNTRNRGLKISFLRGFYEGDGVKPNFNKKKTLIIRARFVSTNIIGLRQIAKLLRDLNIKSNLHFNSKADKLYELCLYCKNARMFISLARPLKCRGSNGHAELK